MTTIGTSARRSGGGVTELAHDAGRNEVGISGAVDLTAPSNVNTPATATTSAQYTPVSGLRYQFEVTYGTQDMITRTYQSSNWVGVFNLGNSTNFTSNTVVTAAPQLRQFGAGRS